MKYKQFKEKKSVRENYTRLPRAMLTERNGDIKDTFIANGVTKKS